MNPTEWELSDLDPARIDRLEAATERLSQNVIGLSTSLAIVSEISQRQADLEKRSMLAEAKVDRVEETSVSKADIAKEQWEYRKAVLNRVYLITAMVTTMMMVIGGAAFLFVHGTQKICHQRNMQSQLVRQFLVHAGPANPTPAQVQQYGLLDKAFADVDCGKLL